MEPPAHPRQDQLPHTNGRHLGKKYEDRNAKLCTIIQKIAEGLAEFSTDIDALGDAYEYLIGQFAAGSGKKAGEFYTPQQISDILSAKAIHTELVTLTQNIQDARDKHNAFLQELGLPALP